MPHQVLYEFGPFRLDTRERILFRDGRRIPLKPKVYDTLLVLIKNTGRVVEKEELMKEVWPDTFVEENNLTGNIFALRRAFGEHQYIETIPRRGYRFTADIKELEVEPSKALTDVATNDVGRERRGYRWKTALAPTLIALTALAVIAGVILYRRAPRAEGTISNSAAVKSIAVLPFKPLGEQNGDEVLSLGMADALITRLSNLQRLVVRPSSSVLRYTAPDQDPLEAGRQQKVDAVLDGRIQRTAERVRVTVQLLRVQDGKQLWADKFDEKFTDIFALQDAISERVATALALQLTGSEQDRLTKRYTENAEAYQLYLKGRYFWNKRTRESLQKGIEYFSQAIEKDSRYGIGSCRTG